MAGEEYETIIDAYGPAAFPVVPKAAGPGRDRVFVGDVETYDETHDGVWLELPCDEPGSIGFIRDAVAAGGEGGYGIYDTDYSGPIGDLEGFPYSELMSLEELSVVERLAASCTRDERLAVAAYVNSRDDDESRNLLCWANALWQADVVEAGVAPLIGDRFQWETAEVRVGLSVADTRKMHTDQLEDFFSREKYGRREADWDGARLHLDGFYNPMNDEVDKGLYTVPELVELGREAARGRLSREEAYTGVKGELMREAALAAEELAEQPWVSETMRAELARLAEGDEAAWEPWLVVACADIVSALGEVDRRRLGIWAQHNLDPSDGAAWVAEAANAAGQADKNGCVMFSEDHGSRMGAVVDSPDLRYADWLLDPECGGRELTRHDLEACFDYEAYGRDLLIEEGQVSGDFYVPHELVYDLDSFSWDELEEGAPRDATPRTEKPFPLSRQQEAAVSSVERGEMGRDVPTVSRGGHDL